MTGGFQFLIVQLKAMVAEPINVDNKFQFLRVQLKGYSSLNFLYLVTVSIPYSTIKRYAYLDDLLPDGSFNSL